MAKADYRLCDVCDEKTFYDSTLSYEWGPSEYRPEQPPYRIAGEQQYADAAMNAKHGMRLGYLGDWAVICDDCAKAWRARIEPIAADGEAEYLSWTIGVMGTSNDQQKGPK